MYRILPRRALLRFIASSSLVLLFGFASAQADFVTIDFDTLPVEPLAPTIFSNPRQDLAIAGLATVEGGTLISTPTGLASFDPGGGLRNAYGTQSDTSFGYAQNLTINFDPSKLVTRVTGTLFNGFTDLNTYTVSIFDGANLVGSTDLVDLSDTSLPDGFGVWDLSASSITRLVITPDTTFSGGSWDYFIDNVGVTFTTAVPEPSSVFSMVIGLSCLAGIGRRVCLRL
ncbi:PEP-CTERM sorting domain-containing protein [Tundrisphaera lichenicola]|uniref:PEP-CTERM sorting domain-containing protein n=1 Tax=Tundrisphaera lichenicola TaxID=2029860 RepID=UPI003EBE4EED